MLNEQLKQTKLKKIAIQGGFGAFHEIAAFHYFGKNNIEIVPTETFRDLFQSLENAHADYGIMAIENTVAGSIIPNYTLLFDSNQKIIGEIYLRIIQNLVALPGQTIDEIKEVYSHPVAILQCIKFFENYPHIRLIESIDTALSARDIANKKQKGVGAISSVQAAEMYGLVVMASSIETNKVNYTRFLILADKNEDVEYLGPINKASLQFALKNEVGCLAKILSIFSYFNVNLTKIQSLPILGKEWEYFFYVDVEFSDLAIYKQTLESVKPFTTDFAILGEYTKGKSIQ